MGTQPTGLNETGNLEVEKGTVLIDEKI